MTRAPVSLNGHRGRAAGLHSVAGAWRLVIVEQSGPRLSVRLAESVAAGDAAAVRERMQAAGVDHLVRVAPAEHTVCRLQPTQTGDPEQTAAALALIADAELAGVAPRWRCAAGLVQDPRPSGEALALLTAWREAGPAPAQVAHGEQWTTEIAALAQLRFGAGQLAIAASRGAGAISLIASGGTMTVARTIREANDTPELWRTAVLGAAAESCRQVGADVQLESVDPGESLVWLDPTASSALRGRIQGLGEEPDWLSVYGVALGAAALGTVDDPTQASLASLRATPPVQRRPLGERIAGAVASPRRAAAILAGSIALMVLAPLAVAWARVAVLEAGASRAASFQSDRAALAQQAALYEQLQISRLPMTKLLADISGATPPHVVIDTLRLARDQGLILSGRIHVVTGAGEATAPENPQDLITQLERNLAATGVFGEVRVGRIEVSAGSVVFEMSARVDRPLTNARPAIDFAERSLAQWLYGERGDNTARPVALAEPAAVGSPNGASRRPASSPDRAASAERSGDIGGRDAGSSSRRPEGSGSASEDAIPAELTDEQIKALDRPAAMREMVSRMNARNRAGIDEGVKARLEAEIAKLRAQSRGESP
ncbi:MAG: hypothetical protein ACF8R7_10370 [Phycisphaerales bacterium JB039]